MGNKAVANAVKKHATANAMLGHERTAAEIEAWHNRQQSKFKLVKEKSSKSGGERVVGTSGEQVGRGMVSLDWYRAMVPLFGRDIAIVPPAKLLAGGGSGMTAVEGDAEMAKATARREAKKALRQERRENDDALSPAGSEGDSDSYKDAYDSEAFDSEEAAADDDGVGEDVDDERTPAALQADIRQAARRRFSTPKGNKNDRRAGHLSVASHNAFQDACAGVTASTAATSAGSKSHAALLAELDALDALKARGMYNEDEYDQARARLKENFAAPAAPVIPKPATAASKAAAKAAAKAAESQLVAVFDQPVPNPSGCS